MSALSSRAIRKIIQGASSEQDEAATRAVKEKVLTEEMGVNPALAKQVVDGDITVAEAELRTANQSNRLGVGEQAEAVDDVGYINQVRAADPDGIKLFQVKQGLSDADKNKLTMAEIAYKKGDPKPLAAMYRTLGIAGAVGAGAAVAEEDVPVEIQVADRAWADSGTLDGISNETQFERADTPAELEEPEIDFITKNVRSVGEGEDWDNQTEFAVKNAARSVAGGLTLGHADEAEGIIRSVFNDTSYADEVEAVRKEMQEFNAVNPRASIGLDFAPAILTGNAFIKAGQKAGQSAAKVATGEGYLAGWGYAETPEEALVMAPALALAGGTLGKGIDWMSSASKRANTASKEGARTQADDQLDDDILTQSIEPGGSVFYKTNNGGLAKAEVLSVDKKAGTVKVKSGDTQASVKVSDVEKIEVKTDKEIADYERLQDFDNARGQYKPRRQVIDYEETVKQGRTADDPIMRDATWRDATTAGELWDGMKDGVKKWYDQKLTGADDMLSRRVSKAVGARFSRASQNAIRWSTNAFIQIGEPLRGVAKLADDDRYFKALVMDFTNARKLTREGKKPPTQTEVEDYIRKNLGEDDVKAFRDYMDWNRKKKADHVDKLNGREAFKEYDHIHTQLNKQGKEKLFKNKKREDDDALSDLKREEELALKDDGALEYRNRDSMVDGLNNNNPDVLGVDDYFNPFFSDFRRTSNLEALYQLAKVFGLDTADESFQPSQVFDRIEKSLIDRGIDPKAAKLAADTMKDDFVGGSKTPNNWLQALNSVGYMGSLAGPKSAILNVHDILVAGSVYGGKSMRSLFDDMGYSVSERGIRQNVGEFRNQMIDKMRTGEYESGALARDLTRKGTDALMTGSGFAALDRVGKKGVTKMVIQDAVDNVDNLADRWGFYFSKRELDLIEKQIRKHGTDVGSMTGKGAELFEELFFAGLGQQQLISSSGRPAAWSRNPNARFMWALRGFAIKQQALLLREITDKVAEGKTKEAAKFMGRYAAFAAGGFGFVNESRQFFMGDGEFTWHGMLMGAGDQIVSTMSINTIGLNDYQWGRMMRNGVTLTFLESVIPIGIDIPKDMVLDTVDALDGTIKGESGFTPAQRVAYPVAQLPIIKQPVRLFSNLEDNVGLPNPMRQFTDMYIETELPKDGQ